MGAISPCRSLLVYAAVCALAVAPAAQALVRLKPSPYLAFVADPPCEVTMTPATAAAQMPLLASPSYRVFCLEAGDYRSLGIWNLAASGTASQPRYLRYAGAGAVKAFQRSSQALVERVAVSGDHWVVQGLTVQPLSATTTRMVHLFGADHVVVDGNLIDGVDHPNGTSQVGVIVQGDAGDDSSDNTIQRNLIRNGDQSLAALDYSGVQIRAGTVAGEDNDRNRILDNEIVDWGDGVAVAGWTSACDEPGVQHGTVIDGNDVYLTSAKYVDCTTGAFDPEGDCACAENGVDVKADPGASPADWTLVTRNRIWGFRPTTEALVCGGSGAVGQAVTAGNHCPAHVLVAKNVISDSTIGIDVSGTGWIVAGNLLQEIRPSDGRIYGSLALLLKAEASDVDVQWNTIVSSTNGYDDRSSDTDTRCNAFLDVPEQIGWGHPRGVNHVTAYNYLYHSGDSNIIGATNERFITAAESVNQPYCYERRRWTGVETVCIPFGATIGISPHEAGAPHCDRGIAAAFGFPSIGYWEGANGSTCGLGAELVLALGALGWLGSRSPFARR